jgi:hypothetical protein
MVTETPNTSTGWQFMSWSVTNGVIGQDPSVAFLIVKGNVTLSANFVPIEYNVTVTVPYGDGSAYADSTTASYGQIVTVTASADSWYSFAGWSFDIYDSNVIYDPADLTVATTTIQVFGNTTVNAYFGMTAYSESGSPIIFGEGTVTLTQTGGFTPANGQNYTTILGSAYDGWEFNYWLLPIGSLSTISTPSSGPAAYQASLYVFDNFILAADFTTITSTLTGAANPVGSGVVTFAGQASTTGTLGQVISISASPAPGYTFSYWTVTATDSDTTLPDGYNYVTTDFSSSVSNVSAASTSLTIPDFGLDTGGFAVSDMNLTVIANFVPTSFTISVIQSSSFTITVSPSQAFYNYGDTPNITITPSSGSVFSAWNVSGGMVSGNTGSDTLTVCGNVTLTAFSPAPSLALALQLPEHKLGTVDATLGVVNPNDLIILNARLNGFNVAPFTDADCDLSGDGYVTTADRVLLNRILNGIDPPRQ